MKKLTLGTLVFLSLLSGAFGACPSHLLVKKSGQKTSYHPETLEKLSSQAVKLINSVGCNPEIRVMSKATQVELLKREYNKKLENLNK